MAVFIYDKTVRAEFDDRALAHLQVVILAKLRRGESFSFSWSKRAPQVGRTTVWLSPSIPLIFDFGTKDAPELDRDWLELLSRVANSNAGLRLVPTDAESDVDLTSSTHIGSP
ncbi:DUF7882 family protein [Marisediminicola senii]|uniref:DUF7882 family protein n=1 Tax=Marisediminicola senii TaxID=2711233 RepID=UPI0013ED52A9|nr:ATP-dependent DNA ligase [Marisediminicola senii]